MVAYNRVTLAAKPRVLTQDEIQDLLDGKGAYLSPECAAYLRRALAAGRPVVAVSELPHEIHFVPTRTS